MCGNRSQEKIGSAWECLAVLASELIEDARAVFNLVTAISGLYFPIVDDVLVRVASGSEVVTEGEIGLL